MKNKKKILLFTGFLMILYSLLLTGCEKINKKNLEITCESVVVYKDYAVEDLNREIQKNDIESYMYFDNDCKEYTSGSDIFYKFWINISPSVSYDEFCNGESWFILKNSDNYSEHYVYLLNPFGKISRNFAVAFNQGDLSDEDVEKEIRNATFSLIYKDLDGKNCSCDFKISDNAEFEYIDYNTL